MRAVVHAEHLEADHWWFRARRTIFTRVLDEHVRLPENARILDVGPGSGVNLPVLRDRGRVTVLDVSRFSLETCLREGAGSVVQADAQRPPFQDGAFDLICALDVIEHLDDDERTLRECRRLLAPDGWLLVSVPAFPLLWGRQDVLSEHKRRYRRGQLAARLHGAGFRIERASYFNTLLFPPILATRLAMRPFLDASVRRGSDLAVRLPFGLDGLFYRLFACERHWLARRSFPYGVSQLALARPAGS